MEEKGSRCRIISDRHVRGHQFALKVPIADPMSDMFGNIASSVIGSVLYDDSPVVSRGLWREGLMSFHGGILLHATRASDQLVQPRLEQWLERFGEDRGRAAQRRHMKAGDQALPVVQRP